MGSAASETQMTPIQSLGRGGEPLHHAAGDHVRSPQGPQCSHQARPPRGHGQGRLSAYLSPREVASQLPTQNPGAPVMLDRIFWLLASCSVLTCTLCDLPDGEIERLYGLTPVCKFLVKNEDGVSIAPLNLIDQDRVNDL